MRKRKITALAFMAILIIAWLVVFVIQVEAQTAEDQKKGLTFWHFASPSPEILKCKSEAKQVVRSDEQVESLFDTGFFIGVTASEGMATCENGETIEVKSYSLWTSNWPKETISQVITRYRFKDLANIISKGPVIQKQDPKGEATWLWEGTSEIIRGTGRFKEIKGTVSFKGKQLPPDKRSVAEFSITYTLPPK